MFRCNIYMSFLAGWCGGFFCFHFLRDCNPLHTITDWYFCRTPHIFQLCEAKIFEWQILITIIQLSSYSSVFTTTFNVSVVSISGIDFNSIIFSIPLYPCFCIKHVHNCCSFCSKWGKSFKILSGLLIRYNPLTRKGKCYGKIILIITGFQHWVYEKAWFEMSLGILYFPWYLFFQK